ncbi:MAG: ABC transporter permease [Candidatus Krumholzibacteriales bacterium]
MTTPEERKKIINYHVDPARIPVRGKKAGLMQRLLSSRTFFMPFIFIVLLVIIAVLAPVLTPYQRDAIDMDSINQPGSASHFLGTDNLGRDLFTRLIYGARYSLLSAFAAVLIAVALGLILGGAAGFYGGWADSAVSSFVDLFLSVPLFLILLVASSAFPGSIWVIPLIIGAVSWMEIARVTRAEIYSLKSSGFVQASVSMGERPALAALKHILPAVAGPVAVAATIGLANAMLIESALSFLGFGIQPPTPTWGNMLDNGRAFLRTDPMAAFAPGFMIFITCLCFNFIGRSLQSALSATDDHREN